MTSRQVAMAVKMRSLVAEIGERIGECDRLWSRAKDSACEPESYLENMCREVK